MPFSPDEVLEELRAMVTMWEMAEAGSTDEFNSAERLTSGFAALDDHIRNGGLLPAAWRVPLAPPSSKDPDIGSANLMGAQADRPLRYSQGQDGGEFGEPVGQLELDAALAAMPKRRGRWWRGHGG